MLRFLSLAPACGLLYNFHDSEWFRAAGLSGRAAGERMDTAMYECDPCGYVYDPAVGDPDNGIAPGTAFADLPDDWVCPICGASKDEFKEA